MNARILGPDFRSHTLNLSAAGVIVPTVLGISFLSLSPFNLAVEFGLWLVYLPAVQVLFDIANVMPGRGKRQPLLEALRIRQERSKLQIPVVITVFFGFLAALVAFDGVASALYLASRVAPFLWFYWDVALTPAT